MPRQSTPFTIATIGLILAKMHSTWSASIHAVQLLFQWKSSREQLDRRVYWREGKVSKILHSAFDLFSALRATRVGVQD
jgi:hypothetical protein